MHFCTRFNRLFRSFFTISFFYILLLVPNSIVAQVELNTSIATNVEDNALAVEVTVRNFTDIVAMQFSVNWDPTILQFIGLGRDSSELNLNASNFNTAFAEQGELPIAWLLPSTESVSLPDGTVIFQLLFTVLSNIPSEIYFDSTPTPIEFVTSQGIELAVTSSTNRIELDGRLVTGQIFIDENGDCNNQPEEVGLRNWLIELDNGQRTFRAITDRNGFFTTYLDPATYTIRPILPENNYWLLCESAQTITITEETKEDQELYFAAQPILDCPAPTVNISTPFLRRCFENYYRIEYCNQGTALAEAAYILVELPTELSIVSSPLEYSLMETGVYRFEIGELPINACDGFTLTVLLDCEMTELGQTFCVRANIFPNEICEVDQLWSGASLDILATCEGDSVRFDIENVGEGDMGEPEEFVVIQDMIMFRQIAAPVQLASGATETLKLAANGATYRLQMKQVPFHPTTEQVSASIEGCGLSEQGTVSRGFINMFERSDESPFVDEDCQENIGAFDPNDKTGYPNGYGPKHFIDQNKQLTYHIRFQNTGTDTAFNVVVLDTLSEFLDVSTFQPLAASHEYEVVVQKENILRFNFNNIELVDSVKNEPLSHGFIRFSIDQKQDIPLGTVITNSAAIYFDFNEPVITNQTAHTLGRDYIEARVLTSLFELPEIALTLSPNPFNYSALVQLQQEEVKQGTFLIYDIRGRLVQSYEFQGNQLELYRKDLVDGVYLFKVVAEGRPIGRGKLVIQ